MAERDYYLSCHNINSPAGSSDCSSEGVHMLLLINSFFTIIVTWGDGRVERKLIEEIINKLNKNTKCNNNAYLRLEWHFIEDLNWLGSRGNSGKFLMTAW